MGKVRCLSKPFKILLRNSFRAVLLPHEATAGAPVPLRRQAVVTLCCPAVVSFI